MVSGSEHQHLVFVGLLNDLQDLGSDTFREHWWYRAEAWRINTNASVNRERQNDWKYLMERVGDYRRKNEL